jgi:hypothetical protein
VRSNARGWLRRGRAAGDVGLVTSWLTPCRCCASTHLRSWLPGVSYLYPGARTTLKYTEDGLCNTASLLYDINHCNQCRAWQSEVLTIMLWSVVVIEHLLILFKMLLAYLIPDQPRWIVNAIARKEFHNEMRAVKKRRASSIASSYQAHEREIDAIEVNASDDKNDDEGEVSTGSPGGPRATIYSESV